MNENERTQYLIEIGNRIKQLRIERDMSQDELAKRCGYTSRSTINKIELGINDIPQSKIKSIAEALGVSVGEILCWTEMDKQYDTKKIEKEVNLIEQIEHTHGKRTGEAIQLFVKLDDTDQEKTIERMETFLESDKYSIQKESSKGKAI